MMNQVDNYINSLEGLKQKWVSELVSFMREAYPDISETFNHKIPTYQGDGFYIAFAAHKSYFSFYTSDVRVLSLIQELSPTATLGKTCAKLKYSEQATVEILIDAIKEVVQYHSAQRSNVVTDLQAVRKWKKKPPHIQQLLINNVFCGKCGVTTIVDYVLQNDRFGTVLKGKCKKCGQDVARVVEDN